MRASLALLLLLAACGGDTVGGLSGDEAERLDGASTMLDEREVRFEDRHVDETFPAENAAEDAGPGEGDAAED